MIKYHNQTYKTDLWKTEKMKIPLHRESNGIRLEVVINTLDTQSHSRLSDFRTKFPTEYTLLEQDIANGLEQLAKSVSEATNAKG